MLLKSTLRLLFIMALTAASASGQTVTETINKTLWCPNDTFALRFDSDKMLYPYRVSDSKISPGTDGGLNRYTMLYYGKDSIRLNYHNKLPYAHIIYVKIASPKGERMLRFHYNERSAYFSEAYMQKNKGNIQYDIPEAYELANIIWTLSPSGQRSPDRNLNKTGPYYERILRHFKPYMNHPIFKALDFPADVYFARYFDFRENSFAFTFQDTTAGASKTKLLYTGPYYYVYGDSLADTSLFGTLRPLVEDFARQSKFRKFYKDNRAYYQQEIQRLKTLLPVRSMWEWLETEFPKQKYQSYRVVFSPLIEGSHSTQRFSTYWKNGWFIENVMFICGSNRVDVKTDLTEKQKEGLMSGVVFTEIDHNYVNPTTDRYQASVDSVFSRRSTWAEAGGDASHYPRPHHVFNEYMTHALFCLYVADHYEKPVADFVIQRREELMVSARHFIRFREFNQELLRLRREHPALKASELYPLILTWCKTQH